MIDLEEYIWEETSISPSKNKYLTVIIYDISENKNRYKMVKVLEKYGLRVQKSAFEALLTQKQFEKLKREVAAVTSSEDSVKIYRLKGVSEVHGYGKTFDVTQDDLIII